jgi:murein DD-endopeptidase MepM/ murein hydrolase activator NlpD
MSKDMKRILLKLAALATIAASPFHSASAQPRRSARVTHLTAETPGVKNIFWQPNDLKQGSPGLFTVEFDRTPTRVTATWIGKTLSFFKTDNPKVWYSLAGDDLETQPDSYNLVVTATLPGGHVARSTKKIDIAAANFLTGSVDVPENFVEPDAAGLKQIASDNLAKAHAYAHFIPTPQWSGNFKQPVVGKSTPSFGESRILNEEKESLHRGTDYPVNEGTLVEASNAGTVVLAKDLFYEGGCVIIDHGQKLFTIYMHLSKIEVEAGDKVQQGAHLGLSGKTGRVTGPHMHFGVRWNGAYLDPVQLLALTLPPIPANEHETRPVARRTNRR